MEDPYVIEITLGVIEELKTRRGFDWWWDELDPTVKLDIMTALKRKVKAGLSRDFSKIQGGRS